MLAHLGEGLDLGHGLFDARRLEAHQASSMPHILAGGELGIESHAEFEDGGDAAIDPHGSLGGPQGASD